MGPDPRIDQLLEIVKDTNRTVHKMRRSMLWGRVGTIVVWLAVIFGPVVLYYLYLQSYIAPYMQKIQQFETQLQTANEQTQNYQSEISSFFGNLTQQQGSSTTTVPKQ